MARCRVSGCQGKPVARGLCAKHYMQARRTGSTEAGKRGPKPSPTLAALRDVFRDQSPRTQARYIRAFHLLAACGDDIHHMALEYASRPNGSINVSKLLRLAEEAYLRHLTEIERADDG